MRKRSSSRIQHFLLSMIGDRFPQENIFLFFHSYITSPSIIRSRCEAKNPFQLVHRRKSLNYEKRARFYCLFLMLQNVITLQGYERRCIVNGVSRTSNNFYANNNYVSRLWQILNNRALIINYVQPFTDNCITVSSQWRIGAGMRMGERCIIDIDTFTPSDFNSRSENQMIHKRTNDLKYKLSGTCFPLWALFPPKDLLVKHFSIMILSLLDYYYSRSDWATLFNRPDWWSLFSLLCRNHRQIKSVQQHPASASNGTGEISIAPCRVTISARERPQSTPSHEEAYY